MITKSVKCGICGKLSATVSPCPPQVLFRVFYLNVFYFALSPCPAPTPTWPVCVIANTRAWGQPAVLLPAKAGSPCSHPPVETGKGIAGV